MFEFVFLLPFTDAGLPGSTVLTGFLAALLGGVKPLLVDGMAMNNDEP
jgi:hypothetical protein